MTLAIATTKFSTEQIELIKTTLMVGKNAPTPTNDELALFLAICDRMALDPFAKQIYPIYRKGKGNDVGKWTVQVSVDGLRAIADRTGQYAGSDEPLYDEGLDLFGFEQTGRKLPTVCKVTVWKIVAGIRCSFVGTVKVSVPLPGFSGLRLGIVFSGIQESDVVSVPLPGFSGLRREP